MSDEDADFASQVDRTSVLRSNFAAGVASVIDANDTEEAALPVSAAFVEQLTEVVWSWTTTALAPDLEAFARHAKRAKVTPEDVVLAARKNDTTAALLQREAAKQRAVKRKVEGGQGT